MVTASASERVRPPAVAGLFYSADPRRLEAEVARMLAAAAPAGGGPPKALIAPHAGYVYSGPVAAEAFATLRDEARRIARVVVIGPSHFVPFRGIARPTAAAFDTPLGRVPVDHGALAALDGLSCIIDADAPHARDHALEVELPFLQGVLGNFSLAPLLVGEARPQEVGEALARLWGGPETLIVVSSDLSHYHDYATARRLDAATAAAIETGAWEKLGPDSACGRLPIAGLLIEAGRRGLAARRLALCNSGDTAGSRDSVVGYGAWAFAESAAPAEGGEATRH